jgi:lambda repressor-like predicted transcriptional regulator
MVFDGLPQPGDWPWHKVLYALRERGETLTSLGQLAKREASGFAHVKNHARPFYQSVIAAKIGLSPLAIWPSRYDATSGRPLTEREWRERQAL